MSHIYQHNMRSLFIIGSDHVIGKKGLLPLPDGPRINLLRLVQIPFFIGSSLISTCTGFPVSRSPKPDTDRAYRRTVIGFKIQKTSRPVLRNVSKVSFIGKSASLPGIPAQKICGAPVSFLFGDSIHLGTAQMIPGFSALCSSSFLSVQTSTLKCALTGSRCC